MARSKSLAERAGKFSVRFIEEKSVGRAQSDGTILAFNEKPQSESVAKLVSNLAACKIVVCELRRTREENRKLKQIISYGNLSMLAALIDQYMDYSRAHLKKIATEIQLTDYEQESLDKVIELISHLEHLERELCKLIEVGEEGRILQNASLKADVRLVREMLPKEECLIKYFRDNRQAVRLEISRNTLKNWERGAKEPYAVDIEKIWR